jgi:hypothetical protein
MSRVSNPRSFSSSFGRRSSRRIEKNPTKPQAIQRPDLRGKIFDADGDYPRILLKGCLKSASLSKMFWPALYNMLDCEYTDDVIVAQVKLLQPIVALMFSIKRSLS